MERELRRTLKTEFRQQLAEFVNDLSPYMTTDDMQWTIKGFIDAYKNIFTISTDTRIVSKILEIHIFPEILKFAALHNYRIVLADHQNYYPDLSFVSTSNEQIKFAVDLKTTYRLPGNPEFCNGFTLGSHGEYFVNRTSRKNIQFPYSEYLGHFCLGIIYSRTTSADIDETRVFSVDQLPLIISVIKDLQFFVCEKWEIASDKRGSGNTANIGSINNIQDILSGNGMFKELGEAIFDDYWMNYGKITTTDETGAEHKIKSLENFLNYKGLDIGLVNPRSSKKRS